MKHTSVRPGKKEGAWARKSFRPNLFTTILDKQQVISGSRSKRGQNVGILHLAGGISSKTPFIIR